jgi:hypothetical protein
MFTAGTLAEDCGQNAAQPCEMRIGHPSGCLIVEVALTEGGTDPNILKASIGRTVQRGSCWKAPPTLTEAWTETWTAAWALLLIYSKKLKERSYDETRILEHSEPRCLR